MNALSLRSSADPQISRALRLLSRRAFGSHPGRNRRGNASCFSPMLPALRIGAGLDDPSGNREETCSHGSWNRLGMSESWSEQIG